DSEVASSGSNFSRGQKQLVCLARVIAENNKIVILDDPTAELDAETEKLICEAIEKNFASWTVIITAHKLRTILKCDKVMILDRGEIVEFASPIRLMESENEILCGMVQ
ncbi:ABC tran domain containing protein, partial [Asbolus verrucosus]